MNSNENELIEDENEYYTEDDSKKTFIDIWEIENPDDVDLDDLNNNKEIEVIKDYSKKPYQDIKENDSKKILNIYLKQKINISKLKKNIFDPILKNRKKINLSIKYKIKNTKKILDLRKLENLDFNEKESLKSDIVKIKKPFYFYLLLSIYYIYLRLKNNFKIISKSILSLLLIISILYSYQYILKSYSISWYNNIKKLSSSKNKDEIKATINDARFDFFVLSSLSSPIFFLFDNSIYSNDYISNLAKITYAWDSIIRWLDKSVNLSDKLSDFFSKKDLWDINFSELLLNLKPTILDIKSDIDNWYNYINWIKEISDIDLNNKVKKYKTDFSKYKSKLDYTIKNYDSLLSLLWHNKEKLYLIVLQNNDEIRPAGWFMWSMGLASIYKWKIKNIDFKDVYALEWKIKPYRETVPEWLSSITNSFWLRDANYFLSYKDNSEKIKFFLKKAWYDIDWIIYVNKSVLYPFLDLLWWLHFEKINKKVDSENFSLLMSSMVESKIFKVWTLWTPKQILFDFIHIFYEKLKENWDYANIINIWLDLIKNREIVVYSFDQKENKLLSNLWLTWEYDYDFLDFNNVFFTSISWNKSDRYIERDFSKEVIINDDCSIDTKLEIKLKHNFSVNDELNIKNTFYELDIDNLNNFEKLVDIQWRWDNKNFIRIILPKDIVLWSNFWKLEKKDNYNIISFYSILKPKESKKYYINYKLTNFNCEDYNYTFYKQSWIKPYNMDFTINSEKISKSWLKWDFYYSLKNN